MTVDIHLLTSKEYKVRLNQCIHCGMCLQACPTYAVLGTETDNPRGRIALMRAASEGRIAPEELGGTLAQHINLCLACRACETACASGVQYGRLVEAMRATLEHNRRPGAAERFVRWLGLRQMMPHVGRLKLAARILSIYQATGLQRLVRSLDWLPVPLRVAEAILPPIEPGHRDYNRPAAAIGQRRGRVAFFHGCIQEAFLAPVNEASIRVLQRNGYEVHFPAGQTCCGAAQLHVGEHDLARDLARRNIDAFLSDEFDAIVNNAGGCGATLKEYPSLLGDDPVYSERAQRMASRVRDMSEFLADHLTVRPQGIVHARAVYVDSCHLRHAQKVSRQPRDLLSSIPGLDLIELRQPDHCCGSAGVYNIVQAETANAILDMKLDDIAATGASLIVVSNTGCHMQLIAGARRRGLPARVMHIAQVLDLSYRASDGR